MSGQAQSGGAQYANLLDMINGGGAGRAGQRFEGGGLLSEIANAFAKPRGYYDRLEQSRPQPRPSMPQPAPMPRPQATPRQVMGSGMTPANAYVPAPQPRNVMGSGMTPANAYAMPRPRAEMAADYILQNFGPDVGERLVGATPQERAQLLQYLERMGFTDGM